MSVRKAIPEKEGVYFITFTCKDWIPLFKICNAYDAVYNWFDILKQSGHYIIGYSIMPHHVHAVIAFCNTGKGNRLVELPEQYPHSSAKFYLTGEQGIYPVINFMELRDIDLTKGIMEKNRNVP